MFACRGVVCGVYFDGGSTAVGLWYGSLLNTCC